MHYRPNTLLMVIVGLAFCFSQALSQKLTSQPYIAILSQPAVLSQTQFEQNLPESGKSYSYVSKFLVDYVVSAGGMPLTIPYDSSVVKLSRVLEYVQGVVIGGGTVGGEGSEEYSRRVRFIVDYAKNANNNGRPFFVMSIDKGMQEVAMAIAGNKEAVTCDFNDLDTNHKVEVNTEILQSTSFLKSLDNQQMTYALHENPVYFDHKCGIDPKKFSTGKLAEEFNLVATSKADNEKEFVAIFEHKMYLIVGFQFHPEWSAYLKHATKMVRDRKIIDFQRSILRGLVEKVMDQNVVPIENLPFLVQNLFTMKERMELMYLGIEQMILYPRWASGKAPFV